MNWPEGLLDTSVVIGLPTLQPDQLPDRGLISAITMAELAVGPLATDDPSEQARRRIAYGNVLAAYPDPLPFDAAAAVAYGAIFTAVRKAGRKPRGRQVDLGIAAIAMANDLPLFTSNPVDFRGLDDLLAVVALPAEQLRHRPR